MRNSLKERVMKKVIFAVICGLFLVGCAKNEPKPAEPQVQVADVLIIKK